MPFAWGSNDCLLFAADAVEACTGLDLAAKWRGQYADAVGAARMLHAGGGVAGFCSEHLGQEIRPALAQPGDIGIVLSGGRECAGVCGGPVWLAPGEHVLLAFPRSVVQRAWRLPGGE